MGNALSQINEYLDFLFVYGAICVYAVVFCACFVENLFPPFPGDSFIVAAGALVALSRLDLVPTILVVNSGGILSVMLLYFFGRRYGRAFFEKKDYRYFSANDIAKVEEKLARWGALIIIGSRFIVGFRSALAVGAGIGRYPPWKMLVFSLLSYFAFTGLLLYIAAKLVDNLDVIEICFDRYNQIIWPLLIGLVIVYVVRRYRKMRRTR